MLIILILIIFAIPLLARTIRAKDERFKKRSKAKQINPYR